MRALLQLRYLSAHTQHMTTDTTTRHDLLNKLAAFNALDTSSMSRRKYNAHFKEYVETKSKLQEQNIVCAKCDEDAVMIITPFVNYAYDAQQRDIIFTCANHASDIRAKIFAISEQYSDIERASSSAAIMRERLYAAYHAAAVHTLSEALAVLKMRCDATRAVSAILARAFA